MKIKISVGRCLKRKTMLVWVKEYIIKNFATCKSLCNLQEIYTAFKEKHPNANIGFSKFCALRPKCCVLAGSKMTPSVCVCNAHQNVVLLVDAMDWDLTHKDLIKKIICNTESNKCIMHRYESCPGTATLKEFLEKIGRFFFITWLPKIIRTHSTRGCMKYKQKTVGNHRTVQTKRSIFVLCPEFEDVWWELLTF